MSQNKNDQHLRDDIYGKLEEEFEKSLGTDPPPTEPADVTARMYGEALSTVIHEPTGIAAVTHPGGNMVTFWSVRTAKLIKTLALERARGVTLTLDGAKFIVTYANSTDLVQVSPRTLEILDNTRLTKTFLSGSHIFNWNRLTRAA